jgi:hypothetical protein
VPATRPFVRFRKRTGLLRVTSVGLQGLHQHQPTTLSGPPRVRPSAASQRSGRVQPGHGKTRRCRGFRPEGSPGYGSGISVRRRRSGGNACLSFSRGAWKERTGPKAARPLRNAKVEEWTLARECRFDQTLDHAATQSVTQRTRVRTQLSHQIVTAARSVVARKFRASLS